MKTWAIWSEGYLCSGMEGMPAEAMCHGHISAKTFQEACDLFFAGDRYYDRKLLSYWGCRLFDNEADARKSFG